MNRNESEVLEKVADVCRLHHSARGTQVVYLGWVKSYIREVKEMPGEWTSEQKVEAFLTRVAKDGVAAATQNQALNAVRFLYLEVLKKPLGNVAAGLPVALPGALDRKSGSCGRQEAWAWLFPALHPCAHPRTGARVRWRMHEVNVQRAVRAAARRAGLPETTTPHVLRHSYATHAHRDGAAARDLQEVLGHGSLTTTMRYLAADAGRVRSPLERLGA